MFKDLWENKENEPTLKEIIESMKYNIEEKQKIINDLMKENAKKDKIIEDLEREIEMISSGVIGC